MKSKKTLTLVIMMVAVLLGAAFYFLYWIRTPAYALNQTRLAIKEHNTAKFEQYVDLDSVLDNAFEDIIKAESKIKSRAEDIVVVRLSKDVANFRDKLRQRQRLGVANLNVDAAHHHQARYCAVR